MLNDMEFKVHDSKFWWIHEGGVAKDVVGTRRRDDVRRSIWMAER